MHIKSVFIPLLLLLTAVHGIAVFNQDVFTAGSDRNKECYWVNKKQVPLTDGSSPAVAHSIFIQSKK